MTKFVCISDTHNPYPDILLPDGDILLHSGDFSNYGSTKEVRHFLKWFESQRHKHKVFIAGNHDWKAEREPDEFKMLCKELAPSCHYLQDSGVELEGWKIWGSPVQPYFYNWAFNRHRGSDIQRHWDMIPDDTEILLTHGPAFEKLDKVMDGTNQGCLNLTQTIKNRLTKLQLHTFGHLHLEGCTSMVDNGVIYVNASVVDEEYINRPAEQIQVIELFK